MDETYTLRVIYFDGHYIEYEGVTEWSSAKFYSMSSPSPQVIQIWRGNELVETIKANDVEMIRMYTPELDTTVWEAKETIDYRTVQ